MTINDVLEELGVDFRQHGESKDVRAGYVGCVCPWCGGESKAGGEAYYLGINCRTGWTTCWRST